MKHKETDLRGKISNSIIVVEEFNIPLLITD